MTEPADHCPACGSALTGDGESAGLCLGCMFELALESPSLLAEIEEAGEAETLVSPEGGLAPGAVLGGRYRIRALLGRGGMGEVWRAFDLKLRVDVALKALLREWTENARALATLRQEVRSARAVVSPHVCRVFDLLEIDGRELVSMEYIDGITLWDILKVRAPLDLVEAREMALQFLAGIEAIHEADLVHRDIKPGNIMVTRSGRVVVMDFGIAKGLAEGRSGTVSGTPAYMAPEQARGEQVTGRADVFSAGLVLAEMVAPEGLKTPEARRRLLEGVRRKPPEVPESPWAPVITRAVAERADDRFPSASALARVLEEVTLRVAGAEDVRPYPGLASFTEEDADYFFGRELEVEEMWKKLRRPHLLGLIGPSGAGKSSFLRAGLLPVMPTGWSAVVTTPGSQPFRALAQALVPEFAGDTEAMQEMLHFEDPDVATSLAGRWRTKHDEALLIVDQFEELFTQNPPEVEARFAELLGRLALEADVHVLVAMRDDFLFRCHPHESLRPLLSELTLLGPPGGAALRRGLVEPALKCGYRFDDETLVDEMVSEITAERGALPLLAFAAARLWDHRDRKQGLLTREAYEHVGGVGGALAQHAEATLETIGHEQLPIVRELFRNLVTAQGTRAAREQDELLSVFDREERDAAERVLETLVDARLLTTFDEPGDEVETPRKRIEIIHESLLSNWPRMVRWRTQDADSAQLREQLRQAAQLWIERSRPDDLLWTGTSFREYELWRERYPGGLSKSEEEFEQGMVAKGRRRQRQRRIAIGAAFGLLLAVVAVVGFFWARSETARRRADSEALRAEAGKLLVLGRIELENNPTAALAYATRSLELADTEQARLLALEILWRGPVARIAPVPAARVAFSPDGEWLAGWAEEQPTTILSADGRVSRPLGTTVERPWDGRLAFSLDSDLLLRFTRREEGGRWTGLLDRFTIPEGRRLAPIEWDREVLAEPRREGLVTFSWPDRSETPLEIDLWPAPPFPNEPGSPQRLALAEGELRKWTRPFDVDPALTRFARIRGREVLLRSLGPEGAAAERLLGTADSELTWLSFSPDGSRIAALEAADQIPIWSVETGEKTLLRGAHRAEVLSEPLFSPDGSLVAGFSRGESSTYLWDLRTPLDGEPLILEKGDRQVFVPAFHPGGEWIAASHMEEIAFWPTRWPHARVLQPREEYTWLTSVTFSPDSRWLASGAGWTPPHLWPLEPDIGSDRALPGPVSLVPVFDPTGEALLVASNNAPVGITPTSGGESRVLEELAGGEILAVTFNAGGSLAAAATNAGAPVDKLLRVWHLESGEAQVLDLLENCRIPAEPTMLDCGVLTLRFAPDGALYSAGDQGIQRWDLETGRAEWVYHSPGEYAWGLDSSGDGRFLVAAVGVLTTEHLAQGRLLWFDLSDGSQQQLQGWGTPSGALDLDPTGDVLVVGDASGAVRVGSPLGGGAHLLVGHDLAPAFVAVSPDRRWIASSSVDEIRVWPMPDLTRPQLQTLPLGELLTRLRSLTNLTVVEDPDSSTGWKTEVGPFPGWKEVPEW